LGDEVTLTLRQRLCGRVPGSGRILSTALAIVLLLCVAARLSACSRISQSSAPNGANQGTIPGTLRYAEIEEPASMNPLLTYTATDSDLYMFMFGLFFNLDDQMHPVPELALAVPTYENGGISKDGLTLTYHLRKGVKWHDGAPFTSHDVVFTTHAILNPANNLQTRNGWDQIAAVEAPDLYTVRFHLKKIYAPAVSTFFAEGGYYPVLPAHLLEKYPNINQVPFNANPVGTGPFKFVKWVHGDRIELAANPDYWRGPPKLSRIIERFIPHENTILTQMKTHEQDGWFRAPAGLYPEIQTLPQYGYRVQLAPSLVYSHMDFNLKNPILADLRVRQAIAYGIDRKEIVHVITHDVHEVGYSVTPSLSWAYEPNIEHYDYDPGRARALLDQAGWKAGPDGVRVKDGQRLSLTLSAVAGGKTGEAMETLTQQRLRALGIDATIKNYPANLFFENYQMGGILNRGKYDIAYYSWVASEDPDNQSLYSGQFMPPIGQNTMFYDDPIVNDAESAALATYDRNERKKYYSIIQKEMAAKVPTLVIYYQRQIFITSEHLKNFIPAPASTSNWNTWQWEMK
jgi:peptide/nickel transport system substrate-binding protein